MPNCSSNPYEILVSKLYTPKIFQLLQKEWAVVTSLFSEELEHDGPGVKYLVGEFSESKDTWENSYENSDELDVSCSCSLFEIEGILCRHILSILCAITLHIYQNPIYYRDGGGMPVTKILQLKMVLDFFPIMAREGWLDCGHCDSNLMQFFK